VVVKYYGESVMEQVLVKTMMRGGKMFCQTHELQGCKCYGLGRNSGLEKNSFFQFPAWENCVCIVSGFKTSSCRKHFFHWFPALRHLDLAEDWCLLFSSRAKAGNFYFCLCACVRPSSVPRNVFANSG
jgi:hypothetical protein